MGRSEYRYRSVHALAERFLSMVLPDESGKRGAPIEKVPNRVLVLKFGGMGEAVLARSLLTGLSSLNPHMKIDYLVEGRTAEVMTCGANGLTFTYDPRTDSTKRALALLREVRRQRYDAVIDFEQRSLLTAVFTRATGIPVRIGFTPAVTSPRGRMFSHTVDLRQEESMWHAFVRLGRVLDPQLPESLTSVPLACSTQSRTWLEEWWKSCDIANDRGPVVAMHLGVGPSAEYRRWPIERFVSLAERLAKMKSGLTIVLTGAKAEQPLMAEFKEQFRGRVVEAVDLGGIERTAALLERCDLLVCGDTGVMHLAAAMGTPTVGLFGPNTPSCWAPVGCRATYAYSTRLPCSPCINSYQRHIPDRCTASRQSACMWDITCEDVLSAARRVIRYPWLEE